MNHSNTLPYFYFGLFVAIFVVIIGFAIRSGKKRTREMEEAAQRFGFRFLGRNWGGPVLPTRFKTSLLQRTRGRFTNAMTGSADGLDVSLFDYTYPQGKSSVTQTLACFSQDVELPPFQVRPEGFFDKIGDAIVHNDIDFDSHPEFSKRYLLRSPDETNTRKLFTPSLLTYMEQIPLDEKWHVEAAGTSLIVYRGGWAVRPDALPSFLNKASALARTILSSNGLSKSAT